MFDKMSHEKEITRITCYWFMTRSLGVAIVRNNISTLLWKPVKARSEQCTSNTLEVTASLKAKRTKFSHVPLVTVLGLLQLPKKEVKCAGADSAKAQLLKNLFAFNQVA